MWWIGGIVSIGFAAGMVNQIRNVRHRVRAFERRTGRTGPRVELVKPLGGTTLVFRQRDRTSAVKVGVRLLAADEPITLTTSRRDKQALLWVSPRPCPPPVPGVPGTQEEEDPAGRRPGRREVVKRIFSLRNEERFSHQAIADHLNRQRLATGRQAIIDNQARADRLVQSLEVADSIDSDLIKDIHNRRGQLSRERASLERCQAQLQTMDFTPPKIELLNALPICEVPWTELPEALTRRLFESLRLEIRYHHRTKLALCRVTLTDESVAAMHTTWPA